MNCIAKTALLLASVMLLASGCASWSTDSTPSLPPVQVVETCPRPPALPPELSTPRTPDFRLRAESLLIDYFNSLRKLTTP